jgi:hypothetical protein
MMMRLSILAGLVLLFNLVSTARADDATPKIVQVPFDLLATKHIIVKVKINGKGPYRMIFDTGAPVSTVNTRTAKEAGLISKTGGWGGLDLFGSIDQVKIKKLEVGKLKAENQPAIVIDHPTVEVVSQIWGPIEGIIGFPFFARYRMTLDYQSKEMTFAVNGYEPGDIVQKLMTLLTSRDKPATQTLSSAGVWGFSVEKAASDKDPGVTVTKVFPDSPATSGGIRAGDRLLTLDDRWTDSVADCYAAAGHVNPGTPAQVRVLRDRKEIKLIIKPDSGL